MANDNKKINTLVTDDDPTVELEQLAASLDPSPDVAAESEAEAKTYDFDKSESTKQNPTATISALRSDLQTRNESVNRLQYDIEMLRSRWTGLETEIKAREKLTENVNAELRDTRNKLARTKRDLVKRDNEIAALQQQQDASVVEIKKLSDDLDQDRSRPEQDEQREIPDDDNIRSLQEQVTDASATIADRDAQLLELEHELDGRSESATIREQQYAELSERVSAYEAESEQQQLEIKNLKQQGGTDTGTDLAHRKQLVAEQTGQLGSNRQELQELRKQIARTEQYADSIRINLKKAVNTADNLQTARQQLEASLGQALSRIAELRDQLENERLLGADLAKLNTTLKNDFEQEIRQIRLELGTAQETITDHESANEQLASDLIDNRGYRQALESQLESVEKKKTRQIQALERELQKLRAYNSELGRKVTDKDNSIAALLNELASRSRTIDSIGKIENVIHEIDGRMSDRIDDTEAGDRTTRLLIGRIAGQELRFPLFKERLTVGRTSHNDIQLKSQHISRRHAIIETTNDKTRIIDWGSKNGVFVNENRVTEQTLANGDIVTIGTADFRYEERPKR